MKRLTFDMDLAHDVVRFVDRLGDACGYNPCGELRLPRPVVIELLALCKRMEEDNDDE